MVKVLFPRMVKVLFPRLLKVLFPRRLKAALNCQRPTKLTELTGNAVLHPGEANILSEEQLPDLTGKDSLSSTVTKPTIIRKSRRARIIRKSHKATKAKFEQV